MATLAWNDAIRALIEILFPQKYNTLIAKFGYALLFTLVLVLISTYLVRLVQRDERE